MTTKEKNAVKRIDVLASGKTNKQDFPEFSAGGLSATTTQDLSHLFFESPNLLLKDPDRGWIMKSAEMDLNIQYSKPGLFFNLN
jgi:hypothetical protein